MAVTKLSQIVKLNGSFRNSINLYLNLNKKEKIDSYIPTKSSLNILKRYVGSVIKNKDHSTILIGSYGKGKSHLLLILLAIVSMQRTKENNEIVKSLLKKIRMVDEETFEIVSSVWNKKGRFLPVIISGSIDDVSRSFMIALNDALKRENLMNLMPDTFFSIAEDTICRWKKEYPEVYINYEKALKKNGVSINDIKNGLKVCDPKALEVFKSVYPSLMGGEQFNPLTGSEVLPMYQSVGLCDYIKENLTVKKPHILILTGHAGDGKTSIMYQVLTDMGAEFDVKEKLSEITLPTPSDGTEIPLTLSRESGITQNVQLITGTIPVRKLRVKSIKTKDSTFNKGKDRYELRLEIDRTSLDTILTLPMLDYFEELKNGVIATNIDPQLSHGVESLKTQISELLEEDEDENVIEIVALKNSGNDNIRLELTGDGKIREV